MRRCIIVTLLLLAVAGCGGTNQEQIRSAFDKYVDAVLDGDPRGVCRQLVGKDDDACKERATTTILNLTALERKQLRDTKLTDIRVVGRVAQVRLESDLLAEDLRLRKEGRKWLLVAPPEKR